MGAFAQQPEPHREPTTTERGTTGSDIDPSPQAGLAAIADTIDRTARQPEANEERRAEADLEAQQQMARWAAAVGIFTGVQVLVGIAGVVAVLMTLNQGKIALNKAKEANEIARASAEKQLRAYVVASKLYMSGVAPDNSPTFHYTLKNTGQTPARSIRVRIAIQAGPKDAKIKFPFGVPLQKFDLGAASETDQRTVWHDGSNVMPTLTASDFAEFVRGDWTFTIAAYVSYQDVFGRTRRTIFRGYAPNHGMTDGKLSLMVANKHVRST